MDDFLPDTLKSTIGEYSQKLINILTPEIFVGFKDMFNEAYKICMSNNETDKYLMTFQKCIRNIPKFSQTTIETECNRIIEKTGCNYLEDLLTVTHVILLKNLTTIRVGNRQKKIDISIPKIDMFIHKVYINIGRELYKYPYLYLIDISPVKKMEYNHRIEYIIEKQILNTIRDSMPFENIIRSYTDETEEHEEEEFEQNTIDDEIPAPKTILNDSNVFNGPSITDIKKEEPVITKVSFNPNTIISNDIEDNIESLSLPSQPLSPRKLHEETNEKNNVFGLDVFDLGESVNINNLPDAYSSNNNNYNNNNNNNNYNNNNNNNNKSYDFDDLKELNMDDLV
jgi:hypothetical protein